MKENYPVYIRHIGTEYLVRIPDFDINTKGNSVPEAIMKARDMMGKFGVELENKGIKIPKAYTKRERNEGSEKTLITVDFSKYRELNENRLVEVACNIPKFLKEDADREGIDCSRVLIDAIIEKLADKCMENKIP